VPRRAVRADELWIRTGFDKNEVLWRRNNRVAKLHFKGSTGVGATFKYFEKVVALSDRRGWHKIVLPTREKIGSIRLNLLDFYPGRDGDVALSEVALAYRGRQIPLDLNLTH